MKPLVAYYIKAKAFSKQIIQSAFDDILCGTFRVPTQEEMERSLESIIEYEFDEYQVMSKVISKHPGWSNEQVSDEVYRKRMRYDQEYQNNLRQAADQAITEIEQLVESFNKTIKAWKRKNLQ